MEYFIANIFEGTSKAQNCSNNNNYVDEDAVGFCPVKPCLSGRSFLNIFPLSKTIAWRCSSNKERGEIRAPPPTPPVTALRDEVKCICRVPTYHPTCIGMSVVSSSPPNVDMYEGNKYQSERRRRRRSGVQKMLWTCTAKTRYSRVSTYFISSWRLLTVHSVALCLSGRLMNYDDNDANNCVGKTRQKRTLQNGSKCWLHLGMTFKDINNYFMGYRWDLISCRDIFVTTGQGQSPNIILDFFRCPVT